MNRGNARAPIYLVDDDYQIFLEVLKESSKLFQVYISAYCLMSNHYHLLVTTPKANLSRFMRHLNGVYTQRHNRWHKKDGHLFRGRYKAILVQEDSYLTHLVRYIHLNPVQANLVQDPKNYPWSSHGHYLKAKDEEWLKSTPILKCFSSSLGPAKKAYVGFIQDGLDPKTKAFFNLKKPGPIFGDIDFIESIKEKFLGKQNDPSNEMPELRPLQGDYLIGRIKKEVSKRFEVPEESLSRSKRGVSNKPRSLAISLAREISGLHLGELAKHFGASSYKAVSHHHHQLTRSLATDKGIRESYNGLKRVLSN